LDTAFVDLGLDPGLAGLQVYEATSLITKERQLQIDVPLIILQMDTLGSAVFSHDTLHDYFEAFQNHLLKFYPASHEVTALFSSMFPILPPIKFNFPLGQLANHYREGLRMATLFVPATSGSSLGTEEKPAANA
jgi:hypothetical protein